MKGMDLSKNLNVEKLIELIIKQDKELRDLRKSEQYWKQRVQTVEGETGAKVAALKKQVQSEVQGKAEAIRRNEELERRVNIYRMEGSEQKGGGREAGELWKAKFDEMFKVSQKLAHENQSLLKQIATLKAGSKIGGGGGAAALVPSQERGIFRASAGINLRSAGHAGAGASLEESALS